jgi:hypothetical protein
MTTLGHTQLSAQQRSSQILDAQSRRIHPTVLTSHHEIITCSVLSKENKTKKERKKERKKENPARTALRQRRGTASGCRGGAASFNGREYMLVFKGGRRLSTTMKTTLKNKHVFSNVVVKSSEIFTCPTFK